MLYIHSSGIPPELNRAEKKPLGGVAAQDKRLRKPRMESKLKFFKVSNIQMKVLIHNIFGTLEVETALRESALCGD